MRAFSYLCALSVILSRMRTNRQSPAALITALVFLFAATAHAQTGEDRTARHLESIRDNPGLLYAFLREMPKGGDLHSHLSGAVYAESYIAWAVEDQLCIRLPDVVAAPAPCDSVSVPAAHALRDQRLYDRIVDAWSMRNWSAALENGHDRFFGTFGKFGGATRGRTGHMLAEVMRRAHDGRVSYLELMNTPNDSAAALGARIGWDSSFAGMRQKLRAADHPRFVAKARADVAGWITQQRSVMKCGTPQADPACTVTLRFLYQVSRGRAPEMVFAQIMTAFEVASIDTMVVGFNLVQPEDGYISMRDYALQMRMIGYLRQFYPKVKVSLHAGELWPGLVPPSGLRFHIRDAVTVAYASRIGHGVDVMFEDNPIELLQEMARRNVAVEINLSSNAGILGVSGPEHPLRNYLAYNVPVLLSTDDEGVSRSEMTQEYMRAVLDQNIPYKTLKRMALNSIEYSFIQPAAKAALIARMNRDFAAFESKW